MGAVGTQLVLEAGALVCVSTPVAHGVDACAHRAPLAAGGRTVAVLACGPDVDYPRDHRDLFAEIAAHGAVISESPPETPPSRPRFLLRNRVTTALASGTVVVEADRRSGAISGAEHAEGLRRPLMAVPGPVTSAVSAGCHDLIREHRATCVTSGAEVIWGDTAVLDVVDLGAEAVGWLGGLGMEQCLKPVDRVPGRDARVGVPSR
jgi:DNA protecting protein DprA